MTSFKSIRTSLKIATVYTFALVTAVACGKVDSATKIKGTANGTISANQGVGGPVTGDNIQIVSAVHFTGPEINGDASGEDVIVMEARHGSRTLNMNLYPPGLGMIDSAQQSTGTIDYSAQAACATSDCSEFIVMLTVQDTSNGTVYQLAQLYHNQTLMGGRSIPSRTFQTVQDAYLSMTGRPIAGDI